MIAHDEVIYVTTIVSTNMTNTISANVSTNSNGKKVRYKMDCYIFHTVLIVIILLFIIAIICYRYAKHSSKLKKTYCRTRNIKTDNNEFKNVRIENLLFYYFDDIIKFENFGFDNILTDEKSYENNLVYDISYKTLIHAKPLRIRFDKIDGFIRAYNATRSYIWN